MGVEQVRRCCAHRRWRKHGRGVACGGGGGAQVVDGRPATQKLKFENHSKVGFLETKSDRRFQVQNPCPPSKNLGNFLSFLGKEKRGGLGFKAQGFPVTCPGLQPPIDSFTIQNLKEPWRLGQDAQEGFESPLLCIFQHTDTLNKLSH
jgi:hypothetical protein